MGSTRNSIAFSVVLLASALPMSCAMQRGARPGPSCTGECLADIDAKLATLRPSLRGYAYPAHVASAEEERELNRQWKTAESELKNLAQAYPGEPGIEWRLGELYRFGHNLDVPGAGRECVAHLERAIALRPDYVEAHLELGIFYTDADKRWAPLGESNLRKAIELSGQTPLPRAWRALTFAYYYQGKFADSLAAADQYLLLVPDDDDLHQLRKLAHQAASRGATGFAPVGRVILP
jgi:tetratricopeptide (TPR) repeat protein